MEEKEADRAPSVSDGPSEASATSPEHSLEFDNGAKSDATSDGPATETDRIESWAATAIDPEAPPGVKFVFWLSTLRLLSVVPTVFLYGSDILFGERKGLDPATLAAGIPSLILLALGVSGLRRRRPRSRYLLLASYGLSFGATHQNTESPLSWIGLLLLLLVARFLFRNDANEWLFATKSTG